MRTVERQDLGPGRWARRHTRNNLQFGTVIGRVRTVELEWCVAPVEGQRRRGMEAGGGNDWNFSDDVGG